MNPPRIYQLFIVLMIAAYFVLPVTRVIKFPINLWGALLFIAGTYLALSTKRFFARNHSPMAVSSTPNMLHEQGIFQFTRNPMYLGITIGLAGLAIIFSSYLSFPLPLLFLWLMNRYFVPTEETNLQNEFGERYRDYKTKVRRWL